HDLPASMETYSPNSGPTYSRSLFFGSSRITCTLPYGGRSAVTLEKVFPKSCVTNTYGWRSSLRCPSTATYAVPWSKCDASMREIQNGLSPESAFAGSPAMLRPTSVKLTPPSRLTCTFPSSVPAHTTPGITGDSEIEMIVLYETTPSFFESCDLSPGAPIRLILQRSTCLVRSTLATYVSPRLYDLKRRLPPYHTMLGLWGESMYGVFQLNRYWSPGWAFTTFDALPPRPPPPPPPPPPPTRPSTQPHVPAPRPAAPPAAGRMLFCWPVRRS